MVDEKAAAETEEEIVDDEPVDERKAEIEALKERMVDMAKKEGDSKGSGKKEEPKTEEKAEEDEEEDGDDDITESDDDIDSGEDDTEDDSQDEVSLDDALVERAIKSGLSYSKLTSLAEKLTPEELEDVISMAEKKTADAEQPSDEVSQEDEKKKMIEELMGKIPDIDDDWQDDVKQTMSGLKEVIRAQAETVFDLKQGIQQLREGSQQSSETLFIDGKIESLGGDYKELFGEGPLSMLSDRNAQANREKLGRYLEFVNNEAKDAGESITPDEAFDRAMLGAFNAQVSKIKAAQTARNARKRKRKSMNAPRDTGGKYVNRDETTPEGDDPTMRAFNVMRQKLREKQGVSL